MKTITFQENQIKINGLNINYKTIGIGKIPIVLLHGWGVSSDKYLDLGCWLHSPGGLRSHDAKDQNTIRALQSCEYTRTMEPAEVANGKWQIVIPDLPGFGKSEEPSENWNLDSYVEFVNEFVDRVVLKEKKFEQIKNIINNLESKRVAFIPLLRGGRGCVELAKDIINTPLNPLSRGELHGLSKNKKVILIGHSFGGRIAIKYAVRYPEKIEKLILTGAAGIKHPLTIKRKIFYVLAKAGKKTLALLKEAKLPIGSLDSDYARRMLYKAAREKDYFNASPKMKEIMKNVIDEDLTSILDQIKIPTLLLWGKEDKSTPLADGKVMNEKIKNSKLEIVNEANHSLPYQKPKEFANIALEFIKKG